MIEPLLRVDKRFCNLLISNYSARIVLAGNSLAISLRDIVAEAGQQFAALAYTGMQTEL